VDASNDLLEGGIFLSALCASVGSCWMTPSRLTRPVSWRFLSQRRGLRTC